MFFPYSTLPSPRLIPAGACPAPAALCVGLLALSWLRRLRPVRAHAGVEIEHEITQGSTELFCRWQRWKRSLFPGCFAPGGWLHARADWGEGRGGLRGRVVLLRRAPCCSIAVRCAPRRCWGGEPSGKVGAQHQSTPRSLPLPLQGPPAAPWLRCPQPRLTRLAVDLCLSAHNQVD